MTRITQLLAALLILVFSSCGDSSDKANLGSKPSSSKEKGEITVYSFRVTDFEKELAQDFEKETGIKVNWVTDSSDKLLIKLQSEAESSPADVVLLDGAARLARASKRKLLQAVNSPELESRVPVKYRDQTNQWFGFSKVARIAAVNNANSKAAALSTYADLTSSKYVKSVYIRSGNNSSNQSLVASIMLNSNAGEAENWCVNLVKNFASSPKGNDQTQIMAASKDENGIGIVNSSEFMRVSEEVKASVKPVFLSHSNGKTHMNICGAGICAHSKKAEYALKFLLYLTQVSSQESLSAALGEYPIHTKAEVPESLKSLGTFNEDQINLGAIGNLNSKAAAVIKESGWN